MMECWCPCHNQVHPDDRSNDGATPFLWASCGVEGNSFGTGGHVDTVRLLMSWRGLDKGLGPGPEPGSDHPLLHASLDDRNTCVHWAAWGGSLEVLRYLCEIAEDPLGVCQASTRIWVVQLPHLPEWEWNFDH